jgi:hypothetical protein
VSFFVLEMISRRAAEGAGKRGCFEGVAPEMEMGENRGFSQVK